MTNQSRMCDDGDLADLMESSAGGADDDLAKTDRLLADYPEDPRLHFLRGSMLASVGRPIEALPALRRAVELAPEFAIARFQLGFFLLTSGEPGEALSVWGPIAMLDEGHYLRDFVGGLTHLIRDEFEDARRLLAKGIEGNQENPPLNRDMQLLIDQIAGLGDSPATESDPSVSATSFLLDQFSGGRSGR